MSGSAGTPTNSPTTACRPGGAAPCCASTSRRCGRCGPKKRPPTTASSSTSGPAGRGPSRSSRTSRCWSGAAGNEKNFKWIARSADGWITTPRDFDIDEPVKLLQDTWAAAGRDGAPQIVALDFKPVPEKLAHWAELGVTEVLFGLPDKSEDEVAAYVERLAGQAGRGGLAAATDGRRIVTAHDEQGRHFPYRYETRLAPMWLAFRAWPSTQGVTVTDDGQLIVRYGPFRIDAPLSQIQDAHITGPYRWWTAVGARLSLADDGLTFGTNATQGVCMHFEPRIHRVLGLRDHSALNVTVEDCEGLVAALTDAG